MRVLEIRTLHQPPMEMLLNLFNSKKSFLGLSAYILRLGFLPRELRQYIVLTESFIETHGYSLKHNLSALLKGRDADKPSFDENIFFQQAHQ